MHTGAVLLDVEKAFDTVWHNGLIYKLIKLEFPNYLIKIVNSYIRLRSMFVSYEGQNSCCETILAGVPQGSTIGPILFNIYIHDLPVPKNIYISLFADDLAICTYSYRVSTIVNRLNKAINKIYKYYNKWKIKLNPMKTEAIIFTKRRPSVTANIVVNDLIIEWSNCVKYLGVYLDSKLTFTKHINHIAHKTLGSLIKYYPLLNKNSRLSVENKMLIYKVVVRSAMVYACPIWSYISESNYNKLQVQQNKFLRLAGKYPIYTPVFKMHCELNIEKIKDYVKKLSIDYFSSMHCHCNKLIQDIDYLNIKYKHKRLMHIVKN